jgi:hypothetical protein
MAKRKSPVRIVGAPAVAKKSASTANVKYQRDELNVLMPIYTMIRDVIDGEPAIKGLVGSPVGFSSTNPAINNGGGFGGISGIDIFTGYLLTRSRRYLPMPNAEDQSPQNVERYKAYITRAVFYNATARTLAGMVGQIFLIDPIAELPAELETMQKDADGKGLTMVQFARRLTHYTMAFGRAGILVDYPRTDKPASQNDIKDGKIKPIFSCYAPWNIVNWQSKQVDGRTVLTLVVLRESISEMADDGFQISPCEAYRVLRLDDASGNYTVQIYSANNSGNAYNIDEVMTPVDSTGKPFKEIPFSFVGAENNDEAVDKPPLQDMAFLNIAHYRNSADYEESCYLCGQPTLVVIGLTEDWFKNVLKGVLPMGARGGIPLPVGADAHLLQASPNQLPKDAMEQKERQMVALGAKLVQQQKVQRTATESRSETATESSTLTSVAKNCSQALEFAFAYAARFVGANADKVKYRLNTSFELNHMTADDIAKLISTWQSGAITFAEMREGLRKSEYTMVDDNTAKAQITAETPFRMLGAPIQGGKFGGGAPAAPDPNSNPAAHAGTKAAANQA